MVRVWFVAAAIAVGGVPALSADVEIFWDGFDQGDLCAWSNPPLTTYHELEPFDESGANDERSIAETVSGRCGLIEGTVGDPYLLEDFLVGDTDYFEIGVEGPAVLRVKVERIGETSSFAPSAWVFHSDVFGDFGTTECELVAPFPVVTVRRIYLPENGFDFADPPEIAKKIPNSNKWFLNVEDARNYNYCGGSLSKDPEGGAGETYRVTFTLDPLTGSPLAFPYSQEPVQFPSDGSFLVYRVDGTEVSTIDSIETFIDRTTPNVLDTKVYVVRKSGSQLTTLAGDDDFDLNHYDARLADVGPLGADPHFVVVDAFAKQEFGPIDFELTIQYLEGEARP